MVLYDAHHHQWAGCAAARDASRQVRSNPCNIRWVQVGLSTPLKARQQIKIDMDSAKTRAINWPCWRIGREAGAFTDGSVWRSKHIPNATWMLTTSCLQISHPKLISILGTRKCLCSVPVALAETTPDAVALSWSMIEASLSCEDVMDLKDRMAGKLARSLPSDKTQIPALHILKLSMKSSQDGEDDQKRWGWKTRYFQIWVCLKIVGKSPNSNGWSSWFLRCSVGGIPHSPGAGEIPQTCHETCFISLWSSLLAWWLLFAG